MGEPPPEDPPRAARGFEGPDDCGPPRPKPARGLGFVVPDAAPPKPKAASGLGFAVLVAAPPKPKAPRGFCFGAFAVAAPKPANGLGLVNPANGFSDFTSRVD